MEDKEIKSKAQEVEIVAKDSLVGILSEFEKKNPFSMLIAFFNIGYLLSSKFNDFVASINFNQNIESKNKFGLIHDLFGEEKLKQYKKDQNLEALFGKDTKGTKKYFQHGILKDHISIFTQTPIERMRTIYGYYVKQGKNYQWLRECEMDENGILILSKDKINTIQKGNTLTSTFKDILKFNFTIDKGNTNDERKQSFYTINTIIPIEVEKEQVNGLIERIPEYLKNRDVSALVEDYRRQKIQKETEETLTKYQKSFDSLCSEVEGKRVIVEYIQVKDFIVSIYTSVILSIFSNFVIKKLILRSENGMLTNSNYKVLKYIVMYIVPINDIEIHYVSTFFEDFERNFKMKEIIKHKIKMQNFFVILGIAIIFLLFANYFLLDNTHFEEIIMLIIGGFLLFVFSQLTRFSNIILGGIFAGCIYIVFFTNFLSVLSGVINSSVLNHTSFTGNAELCLSGSNLEEGKDMLLSIAIAKFLEDYEKKTGVPLSQDLKDTYTQKIKEEYLRQDVLLSNTIDLKLLNTAYKRILAP